MLLPFTPKNEDFCNVHVAQAQSGLSNEELDRIRAYGDSLDTTNVKLYGHYSEENVKAIGSHFPLNDETSWIYNRMAGLVNEINDSTFKFDLTGFKENFYYLTYSEPDEHFGWHIDIGAETPAPRKLSVVLQLSDPSEYEGGDFEVLVAQHHVTAKKEKGIITAFPSFKIHRVTPVTKGKRRVLSVFTHGPNFR